MGNVFNVSEVVEMAVQIEENGLAFYQGMVEKTQNDKLKELFGFLAAEEIEHKKYFKEMLAKVADYAPAEAYPGEYFAYLQSLAGDHVFIGAGAGLRAAGDIADESTALDIGIRAEQESITFYQEMKKLVLADEDKVLDVIITQEENHLLRLNDLKQAI